MDGRDGVTKRKEKRLPSGRGWNMLYEVDILRPPSRSQVKEGMERSRSNSKATASTRCPSRVQMADT